MNNQQEYSQSMIDKALRSPFRKISFRYDLLNGLENKIGELDGVLSANVSYGEFRDVKRSADFELDEYLQREINFLTDRIQPWFILHMPNGGTVEWPLGIFLLLSPEREISGSMKKRRIGAYDKTLILSEYRLRYRHYIEKGTTYTAAIGQLLSMAGFTKINIPSSELELLNDKEFAVGTSCKEAITELLRAINYGSIGIDAEGFAFSKPYVPPSERPVSIWYDSKKDSIIEPNLTDSFDIAGRANVFVRVARNVESGQPLTAVFVNSDSKSPVSTVNRGREITDYEEIEEAASQEVLEGIVRRAAIEATSAYRHLRFGTALMPNHGSAETLGLSIQEVFPATVKFHETVWEMPLSYDGAMRHEARAVIQV